MRDDDEWVVNGRRCGRATRSEATGILVARTDPDLPKHRGLTFFVGDMELPGIDIRPLRQADGGVDFNEVFLSDVHLPDALRLGDVGQGWGISIACLHSEREGTGEAFARPIDGLLELWRAREDRGSPYALALRDEMMGIWVEARVVELRTCGCGPCGPGRLDSARIAREDRVSEHMQRFSEVMVRLMGPAGQVGFDYDAMLNGDEEKIALQPHMIVVRSRAMSIEGGTNEIQRNIVGERVLGLPGDVRVDKDPPWRDVPRS